MRIAWATDIHLDFLTREATGAFCAAMAATGADAVVITGDIAVAGDIDRQLAGLEQALARPVYFVLGNHDFYGGSIAKVRAKVARLVTGSACLRWLNLAGIVPLTTRTALVGHDGWADGRAGSWERSTVLLNDYRLVAELTGLAKDARLAQMRALADEAAGHLRQVLPAALARYPRVIVATHVPPFAEACWHDGKVSDENWLPHFTCVAVGEVLREAALAHPRRQIMVLCGHTHGAGVVQILPNLEVRTGGAEYGAPAIQEVLQLE